MATHSSILAWKIPWTEQPGGPSSSEAQKSRTQLSNQTTEVFPYTSHQLIKKSSSTLCQQPPHYAYPYQEIHFKEENVHF